MLEKKFWVWPWFMLYVLFVRGNLFAQITTHNVKPIIDSGVYDKWPRLDFHPLISNNGNYISYTILNQPLGSTTTVIRSPEGNWTKQFFGISNLVFTQDNRQFLFRTHDSLAIGALGGFKTSYIPQVLSFQVLEKGNDHNWLLYRLRSNQLVIRDLENEQEKKFDSVLAYYPSKSEEKLVIKTRNKELLQLSWVDLNNGETRMIWKGNDISDLVISKSGNEVVFIGNGYQSKNIFCYKRGEDVAEKIGVNSLIDINKNFSIEGINGITENGKRIILTLRKRDSFTTEKKEASVDVYSYRDPMLRSEQLANLIKNPLPAYKAVLNLGNGTIIMLEAEGMRLLTEIRNERPWNTDYVLVRKYDCGTEPGDQEWNWNHYAQFSIYLLSLEDGSFHSISPNLQKIRIPVVLCKITPDGKFVLWYDPVRKNYFSYEISNGKVKNLTANIKTSWVDDTYDDALISRYVAIGTAGFLENSMQVFLYDRHDIYQVALDNSRSPVCLTNYYGKTHNIKFKFTFVRNYLQEIMAPTKKEILLDGFNFSNKDDGFFKVRFGIQADPIPVYVRPLLMDGLSEYEVGDFTPVRARDTNAYIIKQENATSAPNFFYTSDFFHFRELTDMHPQKEHSWLSSELIKWKTFDGSMDQGILYKPENFNPRKKYPVIFYYYEKYSNSLHRFLMPDANGADIDIPSFVSQGYLVFIPDIHYPGYIGQGPGCYNSVVSAAGYMAKMRWVDSRRMGIDGHSRGGFETNYLVTHTNIFAAAVSGSGYSDAISLYTLLRNGGGSGMGSYELGHQRISATLWQRPELYFKNSPLLDANQVSTPILMMNNKADSDIPFEQGIQFFTSLRRLGKKAWLLQYDNEGHVLHDPKSKIDWEIRMQQFFDHYLKGMPPPVWMTKGIPARLKGIDSGFELDKRGINP